ncbi:TSNA1 protein, partial [Syrrhaptes paradoxus]|nr:TSNA1 protein [Syrrhaptes paradoxus]
MSEVLKYEQLLFGAAASTVNAYEKQKIWWRITNKINAAGRNQRDIGEVKNRWRGLRRRANDKITRHRQERQGPPARAAGRTGNGNGSGPAPPELGPGPAPAWGPRGAAGSDPPGVGLPPLCPPAGVKAEAVKEEPLEVTPEPFPGPATDSVPPGRGAQHRSPRIDPRPPGEGWSRTPPCPPPPELGELGGQAEPLGADFPSILLEHEAEPLSNGGGGDEAGPPGVADGTPASTPLTPAEKRVVQSTERLAQELRAFRREYAESRQESGAVLRGIAQALGAIARSLAQIRDRYLGGHPKP